MNGSYEIGPFRLDARAGVLTIDGVPVALGPRAVSVLASLVEHANRHVSKAALLERAWPGLVVEEGNLAVQISAIRRALGKAPGGERWIETLARRGYRFVGPVTALPDADASPAAQDDRRRSNLPEPLTSFVGRERELVELKRLLSSARLLTLTGIGGIGKTRLALQLAAEVVDAYRDGVWWVELAPLSDPALVPSAVAQVLGVQESGARPVEHALGAYLQRRQLMLVLDNCEHLLPACATLSDALLRPSAGTTVVATSREPLRVTGEQIYPLAALTLPPPGASIEAIAESEAVQLFLDRARWQQPQFELTEQSAGALAELCIHLDGIPLALELAAVRVPSLSPAEIVARLGDRFRLLAGGAPTALPRQRTLRNTLDWSYALLGDDERILLRRLSVFPGPFTLEAAAAISDLGGDEVGMLDRLSALAARSLLVVESMVDGTRYRLLETMRAYAREKLDESGEAQAMQRRHAQYFLQRSKDAYDDGLRLSDADWHARYTPDRDSVRAALDWAVGGHGDARIAVALAGCSMRLWGTLSLFAEGRRRLELAAARIGPGIPQSDQARLWLSLGLLTIDAGKGQALAYLQAAIALYERLDEPLELACARLHTARRLAVSGRCEDANEQLAQARPILEHCGLAKAIGVYLNASGCVMGMRGDLAAARLDYERAVALNRGAGAVINEIVALNSLADIRWAQGDLEGASATFSELAARIRQSPTGRTHSLGIACCNLAGILVERGEIERALAVGREGLPLLQDAGSASRFIDHFALRQALAGDPAAAALLAGFADAAIGARGEARQPNEARARARLQAILEARFDAAALARMLIDGSSLGEEDACRLALRA